MKTSKTEERVKVSDNKTNNKNNSNDDTSHRERYRGYELLLDDDSDVEMEVELPKGRVTFL